MAELDKKWMSKETMIHQIMQTLDLGTPSDLPAYTLILGSGASYGSVPTSREMLGVTENGTIHEKSIPAYLHTRKGNAWPADLKAQEDLVTQFWKDYPAHVEEAHPFRDWLLNHSSGKAPSTPQHVAAAYKALFEPSQAGGLNSPAEARRYLRAITLGEDGRVRLNGTHFFLASLLALQSTPSAASSHYGKRRPFARTLFTTNFDPLLQVSLQLFQVLYYMTDRPELLPPDALATDDHPAVHLFYAHGSVHRPFLANADGEIGHLKDRNAKTSQPTSASTASLSSATAAGMTASWKHSTSAPVFPITCTGSAVVNPPSLGPSKTSSSATPTPTVWTSRTAPSS